MIDKIRSKITELKNTKTKYKRIVSASVDMQHYLYTHIRSSKNSVIELTINAISAYADLSRFPENEAHKALEMAIESIRHKNDTLSFMVLKKANRVVIGVDR